MLYSLSEDADLSFLGERELIQVAIGLYQVIFRFDQEVSISVEDRFEITSKSETWTWTPGAKNVAESLVSLLGRVVEKVRVLPRSRVELVFSGGMQLVITPENHDYESYQITHSKDVFVI